MEFLKNVPKYQDQWVCSKVDTRPTLVKINPRPDQTIAATHVHHEGWMMVSGQETVSVGSHSLCNHDG
jgi:hypothetical protein